MEFFEAFLSTEVIAGVLILAALGMAMRSIIHFSKEAATLRPRLAEADRELNKLREGMEDRRKAVKKLADQVAPIKELENKMRLYFEGLQEQQAEIGKKLQEQEERKERERQKRIKRKKMGFDGP